MRNGFVPPMEGTSRKGGRRKEGIEVFAPSRLFA